MEFLTGSQHEDKWVVKDTGNYGLRDVKMQPFSHLSPPSCVGGITGVLSVCSSMIPSEPLACPPGRWTR